MRLLCIRTQTMARFSCSSIKIKQGPPGTTPFVGATPTEVRNQIALQLQCQHLLPPQRLLLRPLRRLARKMEMFALWRMKEDHRIQNSRNAATPIVATGREVKLVILCGMLGALIAQKHVAHTIPVGIVRLLSLHRPPILQLPQARVQRASIRAAALNSLPAVNSATCSPGNA